MQSEFAKSFCSVEKDLSGSAKMSASWIKQNMLGSPPKRTLTEAEMRVQRAIQKLDIPEWYLNKKSKAPKILKNNTPIDYRQPSWKRGVKSDIMSASSLLENTSDPTGIYKTSKRLKTSMDESLLSGPYGTPRIFENSIKATSPSAINEISVEDQSAMENSEPIELHEFAETAPEQNKTFVKSPRAHFSFNKSGTFPKISPSRKIQNINIVLPPTPTSPVPKLPKSNPPPMPLETSFDICDNSNLTSDVNIFNQTNESSFDNIISGDDKFNTPKKIKLNHSSCLTTNLAKAISPKPFSKKIGTPFETPIYKFKIRAHSTFDGTEQSLFTSALDKPTPSPRNPAFRGKQERILNFSPDSILRNNNNSDRKRSTYWLGEVKPFGPESPKICCQVCGAKAPRIFAAVTTSSPNNFKSLNKEHLSQKFQNIIEAKKMQHGKNLAEEIIQELKHKCTLNSKASYSSLGTKHFVNRLVNDLGGNITEVSEITDEKEVEAECFDSDSRSSTKEELNSARFSTSISMSEFGRALPVTSTLKSNVDRSRFNKQPIKTNSSPFEDDGVHWIPVTHVNFPGTSSLSMMSKRSGRRDQSPSISPITVLSDNDQADERIYQNFYEVSDSKQMEIMKSLKIQKGRILDSGYSDSDRSNVKSVGSDSSLSDGSWSEDFDSSPTESENSFFSKTISDRVFLGKRRGVYVL